MATIRRLEIAKYDGNGQPIFAEKRYDQIFLEGFNSEAVAETMARIEAGSVRGLKGE